MCNLQLQQSKTMHLAYNCGKISQNAMKTQHRSDATYNCSKVNQNFLKTLHRIIHSINSALYFAVSYTCKMLINVTTGAKTIKRLTSSLKLRCYKFKCLFLSLVSFLWLTSRGSTMVEHLPCHPKVKGLIESYTRDLYHKTCYGRNLKFP